MATLHFLLSPPCFLFKPNPSLSLHFPLKRIVSFPKRIHGTSTAVATGSAQPTVELQNDPVQETQKQEQTEKLVLPTNDSSNDLLRIRHTEKTRKQTHFEGEKKNMAPPASIRWCAVALTIVLSLCVSPSIAIYCDEDDCYDLLGVSQSANSSEIKKAYYKLSLKHHPDKNPDPESKKLFVKIANAYEILKDEATREQYDYAIEHPEEVFYNTARYYRAYYGHKTDTRAVLVGVLIIISVFQYFNRWTRYNQAIDFVKKTPAYKNRLRALELERSGGTTNKKKSNRQMDKKKEEDLSKELELDIKGAEKPSIWELIGVRLIVLPYTIGKLLLWYGCWFWRYKVKHAPYAWEDAAYLTRNSLSVPLDRWQNIDESTKEDLIERRLWIKSNLDSYFAEMRKEQKRRR